MCGTTYIYIYVIRRLKVNSQSGTADNRNLHLLCDVETSR
jgi:hypothetical protein